MWKRAGQRFQRPLPGESNDAEHEVDDLEYGYLFDGSVEIVSEKVPEYFGPDESFNRSADLP